MADITDYTRKMKQTATYWAPGAAGPTGQATFAAPITLSCRWEDKQVLFKDSNGKDSVSQAIVYVDRQLAVEGFIYLGVSVGTDPRGIGHEIKAVGKTVNVRAKKRLNKVIV
jgi:hypothetical protein